MRNSNFPDIPGVGPFKIKNLGNGWFYYHESASGDEYYGCTDKTKFENWVKVLSNSDNETPTAPFPLAMRGFFEPGLSYFNANDGTEAGFVSLEEFKRTSNLPKGDQSLESEDEAYKAMLDMIKDAQK